MTAFASKLARADSFFYDITAPRATSEDLQGATLQRFDCRSFQEADVQRELDRFIGSVAKARIGASPTYFSGIF